MKLKNKETGEIGELFVSGLSGEGIINFGVELKNEDTKLYRSLAELNKDWEDVPEEPKEYWYIDSYGAAIQAVYYDNEWHELRKQIGNYFETKEEAELAVRRLKAWKQLEDKGFKTDGWTIDDGLRVSICTNLNSDGIYDEDMKETKKDLDICFGGEE